MKMYFKGTSGIINPIDADGNIIKSGDILTFEWFNKGISHLFKGKTEEDIQAYIHLPVFLVKEHPNGGLFGEDIDQERKLYCHDFRFKHCKVIKPC